MGPGEGRTGRTGSCPRAAALSPAPWRHTLPRVSALEWLPDERMGPELSQADRWPLPLCTGEGWFSGTPGMKLTFPRPPGASLQPGGGWQGGRDYSHSYGERHHVTQVPCGI